MTPPGPVDHSPGASGNRCGSLVSQFRLVIARNPCGSASRASCRRCQASHSAAKSSTAGTVWLTDAPMNVLLRFTIPNGGIHTSRTDGGNRLCPRCGQPAPGVRSPSRRELLARLQRVTGDQPVAAPEHLPDGVGEGEVALNDVDDAQ